MRADGVIQYNNLQKELKRNGFFIDIDDNQFVVGETKHQKNWETILDKMEHQAPLGVFDSLEEVKAFAIGVTVGDDNRDWK